MPSFKDADLAAMKARYESNYALITNDSKNLIDRGSPRESVMAGVQVGRLVAFAGGGTATPAAALHVRL
jgi:hypothetical protein